MNVLGVEVPVLVALGLVAIIGMALGYLIRALLSKDFVQNVLARAALIKTYWKFVLPYSLVVGIAYVVTILYTPDAYTDLAINVLGQVSALIFAIFVGWYAFLQVMESKIEKLGEKAHDHFQEGSYRRARELYEQVYVAHPKNFTNLAELLELYLIIEDEGDFDAKFPYLKEAAMEDDEILVTHYLRVAQALLKQDLGTGKKEIGEAIEFVATHPRALPMFTWQFKELRESDIYERLEGEPKVTLDNFLSYLNRGLEEKQKTRFEGGDYKLEKED